MQVAAITHSYHVYIHLGLGSLCICLCVLLETIFLFPLVFYLHYSGELELILNLWNTSIDLQRLLFIFLLGLVKIQGNINIQKIPS